MNIDGAAAETEPDLRLVTLREAAAYLSVSRGALYGLLGSGQLSSVHIGRSRRIAMVELRRFVRDRLSLSLRRTFASFESAGDAGVE